MTIIVRATAIAAGFLASMLAIGLLTLLLAPGELPAAMLLDRQVPELQFFPYPFTIQNAMHLLAGVALGDLVFRVIQTGRAAVAVRHTKLPSDDTTVLEPRDLGAIREKAREAGEAHVAFRLIDQCVQHFQVNLSVGDTHMLLSTMLDLEMERLSGRYTLVRYIAWVLPTVGFIGTVTGIALALRTAGSMVEPDMAIVTTQLGVAFFTTLVALLHSAVLMLVMTAVEHLEEATLQDTAEHVLANLINRLYVPRSP